MRKVGLLGGTFDPPHTGHLLIAQEALIECHLDEVWFLPNNVPPHKVREDLSSNEDRKQMTLLAIQDNPFFKLSTIEFEREGPSYTIDTVKQLRNKYKNHQFFFIIGGDMIGYLPKWEEITELLGLVTFIGLRRPGFSAKSSYPNEVIEVEGLELDISSTEIRQRCRENRNTRYLLPDNVVGYIKERGLYGIK